MQSAQGTLPPERCQINLQMHQLWPIVPHVPHMAVSYSCRRTQMPIEFFQQIVDNVYEEIANHPGVTNAALVVSRQSNSSSSCRCGGARCRVR
jgi:hypothetical protein